MKQVDLEALKHLALLGALDGDVEVASGEFASLLGTSQQTASRRLIALHDDGLLEREMGLRRQRIRISAEGRAVLEQEHLLYARLFGARETLLIRGRVQTGLGEGRYYLSRPGYHDRFTHLLGWEPYAGTLNLELTGLEANKLRVLRRSPVHIIEAFEAEGRTFGGVRVHPATLGGQPCAAILPDRSHHTTTLEVIAPVRLRDALPCQDGDELEVDVRLKVAP